MTPPWAAGLVIAEDEEEGMTWPELARAHGFSGDPECVRGGVLIELVRERPVWKTLPTAAGELGLNVWTLRHAVARGHLRRRRMAASDRVRPEWIREWLAGLFEIADDKKGVH